MKKPALAFALILLSVPLSNADTIWFTGNELARHCSDLDPACQGYVVAVADMMLRPEWPYRARACFDKNVELGQLWAVTKRYLDSHPEQLHFPALDIVVRSLSDGFPCK